MKTQRNIRYSSQKFFSTNCKNKNDQVITELLTAIKVKKDASA